MTQFVDNVSRLYFKRSDYRTTDELFNEMHKQADILLNNSYGISCYRSLIDSNIYIMEFASLDTEISRVFMLPVWITKEEAQMLEKFREDVNEMVMDADKNKGSSDA